MPPTVLPTLIAPRRVALGTTAGMKGVGSHRNFLRLSSAVARSCGVKSITSSTVTWVRAYGGGLVGIGCTPDRKSTRLNSSHQIISYAVFCLKKKKKIN